MSGELQPFLQPALIIVTLGSMLKFMVVDKLRAITSGLNGHEKRIRHTEIQTAHLQGALRAKGCLRLEDCPLGPEHDEFGGEGL